MTKLRESTSPEKVAVFQAYHNFFGNGSFNAKSFVELAKFVGLKPVELGLMFGVPEKSLAKMLARDSIPCVLGIHLNMLLRIKLNRLSTNPVPTVLCKTLDY